LETVVNRRPTVLALAAGVPAAVLLLVACGGGGSSTSAAAPVAAASSAAPAAGGGGGNRGPAASGEIAAVSGTTMQVQDTSSQTAVTWSSSTRFTKSERTALAAGYCVTATGTPGSGADALTATTVRVVATSGSCTVTRPGGANGTPFPRPSGGARPSGRTRPSGGARPSGAPGGGNFATAFGTVKSVSGSTVTLSGTVRTGGQFGRSPGATPSATPAATTVTLTLASSATVERTVAGTGADAKVGLCATAIGKADSTGTVAATTISLTPKGANGCTGGFGRFPGGGFGG
jgi:hypothetical protein